MKFLSFILLFFYGITYSQYAGIDYLKINNANVSLEYLLQKYIQIPSVSGEEKIAGDFIKSVCKENGLYISSFGEDNGFYNFAASIFPLSSQKPNIILLNHIDVVPESKHNKTKSFSGEIMNGEVYGRGAFDNKGAAVMQLASILNILKNGKINDSKYNITFLAVSCEETQCSGGVDYVIENHLHELNPAVVIGEGPTELTTLIGGNFNNPIFGVSVVHKRSFWLNLKREMHTFGHGSVTPLQYANKEMIEALNRLVTKKQKAVFNDINTGVLKTIAGHKKGIEKFILRHPRFFKPILIPQLRKQPELFAIFSNTITLTNINSNNSAYNKIPTNVEAFLDCRLLPDKDEDEFIKHIQKTIKNDSIKVTIIENMPKTIPSSTKNIFYENISKAILLNYPNSQIAPVMMPNINDLGAFRAKGIPAFATIPVYLKKEHIEGIHNKDEKIPIEALYNGAQVYFDFLQLMME
ncbi:MAG: M20/M25/M40 family metallo-hydrolase [Bacteroidota bacterium]